MPIFGYFMLYSKIYERLYSLGDSITKTIGEYLSFWPNRLYLGAIILTQIISWWLAYFISNNAEDNLLVLHYNVNFGINWIGDGNLIFYFPALSLSFFLLSLLLIFIFGVGRHFRANSHYLMAGALLSNLGIFLAIFLIYIINFK